MKKKGFTLSELLGVIIVLGVILLITFPIITNIIKNGKQKSYDLQMEMIINGIRDYANENRELLPVNDGDYVVLTLGNLKSLGILNNEIVNPKTDKLFNETVEFIIRKDGKKYIYEMNEETYEERNGKLHSPTIVLTGSVLQYYDIGSEYVEEGYKAYDYQGKEISNVIVDSNINNEVSGVYLVKYTAVDSNKIGTIVYRTIIINKKNNYTDGDIVYYDVMTGRGCNNYHTDNSLTGFNGIIEGENSTKTTDNQTSCLKFYSFLDNGGEKIKLILDHNTTGMIAWNSSSSGTTPDTVNAKLEEDTEEWKQIINGEQNNLIARLITSDEVNQIAPRTDGTKWIKNEDTSWYNLHNGSQTPYQGNIGTNNYKWLFDNTKGCAIYGCNIEQNGNNGYWTSDYINATTTNAWNINYLGNLGYLKVNDTTIGVRPVIEVLKTNL